MNKFKAGDEVVGDPGIDYSPHQHLTLGKKYTTLAVDGNLVQIEDDYGISWWHESWFKLADSQVLENAFDKAVQIMGKNVVANSLIEKENKEMTAEQIRDEILRIDVRIEEAKKDIEDAENERNSLVEKLREKGFELSSNKAAGEHPLVVGDTAKIVKINPDYHFGYSLGKIVVIKESDSSDRPYYVEDEDGNTFWCAVDELEKI